MDSWFPIYLVCFGVALAYLGVMRLSRTEWAWAGGGLALVAVVLYLASDPTVATQPLVVLGAVAGGMIEHGISRRRPHWRIPRGVRTTGDVIEPPRDPG